MTIIIPTRPGAGETPAVAASRGLDYPRDRLELIVARGRQPAVQRNAAIRAARGDLIYFLDDDACPFPDNLRRALGHLADPTVQMAGGPNLCPPDAPRLEQVFAVVLSSWLAFGPSRARYEPLGQARASGEKELILCNLLARRTSLIELGGFDESLYPNEENALMDALQKRGGKLIYDPALAVYRRPRPNLGAFIKMLLNYGRGRAEQFRLHPTLGSALNFVPPLFCLYLVSLPIMFAFAPASLRWLMALALAPLGFYGVVLWVQTLVSCSQKGWVNGLLAAPLVMLTHIFYGLGFWRGMFTRPRPATSHAQAVQLEKVPL